MSDMHNNLQLFSQDICYLQLSYFCLSFSVCFVVVVVVVGGGGGGGGGGDGVPC